MNQNNACKLLIIDLHGPCLWSIFSDKDIDIVSISVVLFLNGL